MRDCCVDWRRTHVYVSQTTRPKLRTLWLRTLCPSLDRSLADSAAATACGQMVRLGHQTPKLGHPTPGPALALRRPFVRQHLVGAPLQMPLALCGVATGVHLGPSMLQSVCPCITRQWLDQNPSTVPEINYLQTYRHAHITAGTMDGCMCVRFCVHIHEENLSTESSESICSHCLVIVRCV